MLCVLRASPCSGASVRWSRFPVWSSVKKEIMSEKWSTATRFQHTSASEGSQQSAENQWDKAQRFLSKTTIKSFLSSVAVWVCSMCHLTGWRSATERPATDRLQRVDLLLLISTHDQRIIDLTLFNSFLILACTKTLTVKVWMSDWSDWCKVKVLAPWEPVGEQDNAWVGPHIGTQWRPPPACVEWKDPGWSDSQH